MISNKFLAVDEHSRSIDFDNISKVFITASYFFSITKMALSCDHVMSNMLKKNSLF